jgi:hypothetical protein
MLHRVLMCFIVLAVFAESIRNAKRVLSIDELIRILEASYTKCPPKCIEIWDTLNFDDICVDIGNGTIGGIQGGHQTPQVEKPHLFNIVKDDGAVNVWWKALSTTPAWTPLDKCPLNIQAYFPVHIPTVHRQPEPDNKLIPLEKIAEQIIDVYGRQDTSLNLRTSWVQLIDKLRNPPRSSMQSRTWAEFIHMLDPRLERAGGDKICDIHVRGHDRDGVAGPDPIPHNSEEKYIDCIAPPEIRMKLVGKGRSFNQEYINLHVKVGWMYAFLVRETGTETISVAPGMIKELLVGDEIRVHWWLNTDQDWTKKLRPLNKGAGPWIDVVTEDALFPQILRLTDMGKVRVSQVNVIELYRKHLQDKTNLENRQVIARAKKAKRRKT